MVSKPPDSEQSSPFSNDLADLREIIEAIDPDSRRVVDGCPRIIPKETREEVFRSWREIGVPLNLFNNKTVKAWSKKEWPSTIGSASLKTLSALLRISIEGGLDIPDELRDRFSQSLSAFADWVEAKTSAEMAARRLKPSAAPMRKISKTTI
ncbi:MAG: hypothetical protein NUV85_04050 [Candidatus Berkelbacteria bacterium]|nr:hypothetical protein [Candidatus Berkelbacteria bacterium]